MVYDDYMKIIRFTLPTPKDLNDWLIKQASLHNRSKTQEIISILTFAKHQSDMRGDTRDEKWLAFKGDK